MVKCIAPMCSNATYNKTPEITFHRFPKDEILKKAWLNNLRRENWQPSSAIVICSKHSEPHLLDSSGFHTVLVHGAIPTIFVPTDPSVQQHLINLRSIEEPLVSTASIHHPVSSHDICEQPYTS